LIKTFSPSPKLLPLWDANINN